MSSFLLIVLDFVICLICAQAAHVSINKFQANHWLVLGSITAGLVVGVVISFGLGWIPTVLAGVLQFVVMLTVIGTVVILRNPKLV